MKKVLIISIIVICLVVGGVIFFLNCGEKGKQIELTYTSNGGVPYRWEYEIEDEKIIEFVKSYEIENKNNEDMVGAPISTNYVFKGLKEGETSVVFQYVSIVDGSIDKQERIYLKVDKNKNVSLIAKKNDLD